MIDSPIPTATDALLPAVRPLVTVDIAIFAVFDKSLQTILVQRSADPAEPFPGAWALPGGFIDVDQDDTLEDCAKRKLRIKTGVSSPYLEQVGSWGGRDRDPRGWSATHLYFALLPAESVSLAPGANADDVRWWPINGSRVSTRLAFDHARLLSAALERLRAKVEYTSLPAFLLPRAFTLPDLQHAYEVVLDRPVEKSAFRTRILSAGIIEPIDRQRPTGKRPAQLYRLTSRADPFYFPRAFGTKREE
jgi:ADP-ribose pyrophosphatase YjhB (NUDIX family)